MTLDQMRETIARYRAYFYERNFGPIDDLDHNHKGYSAMLTMMHCHGMLIKMQEMVKAIELAGNDADKDLVQKKWEKLNRWLGFVQGCLYFFGAYSLEELKSHNRSL